MSQIQSAYQHVVLVALLMVSSGVMVGYQYLIQNMGLEYYSFTVTMFTFGVTGFVLSMNGLNFLLQKMNISQLYFCALLVQDAGICLAFPAASVGWLSYVSAICIAVGASLIYGSTYYMYNHYKAIGPMVSSAFGTSTLVFYLTNFSPYLLFLIIGLQWLFFLLFRKPKEVVMEFDRFTIQKFNKRIILALSVLGAVMTQNMFAIIYFDKSSDQLIYSLGLLTAVVSGVFLIKLKIGTVFLTVLNALFCLLSLIPNLWMFYASFAVSCLTTGGIMNGIFAINAMEQQKGNNFYLYLAMLVGNLAGFLSQSGEAVIDAVFVGGAIFMLAGLTGLLGTVSPYRELPNDENEKLIEEERQEETL